MYCFRDNKGRQKSRSSIAAVSVSPAFGLGQAGLELEYIDHVETVDTIGVGKLRGEPEGVRFLRVHDHGIVKTLK